MHAFEDTKFVSFLRDPYIWWMLPLSIFAWGPLLTPAYFFNAHDAKHSVFFLVEFDQTFRDGFLWPRWSPDFAFGYGYPLFNLYAPLAFYIAEILHLLGLGFTAAIKTMYVLATIGAGLGMYGFTQRLFGRQAGLLAAIVYMYVPFHLVEIFVRSDYAEFVALALIPFLFWAFTELVAAPSLRWVALAGFTYGLLALTHPVPFFTFSPLLMVYLLMLILTKAKLDLKYPEPTKSPKGRRSALPWDAGTVWPVDEVAQRGQANEVARRGQAPYGQGTMSLISNSIYIASAGVLGLALAAIYLIPAIIETRYIKVEQWTSGSYNYLQHFVYFAQFFSPEWGYGYSGIGLLDDLSYQLGIVVIALISFALISIITRRFPHHSTALFFLVATFIVIFLMSPLAEPVWRVVPIATLVQFPWRLLGLTAFTMSVVAGSLLAKTNEELTINNSPFTIQSQQVPQGEAKRSGPQTKWPVEARPPVGHSSPLYLLTLVVVLASLPYTLPQYTEIPDWAETPLAIINWDRASIADRVGMVSVTQEQPKTSPLEQQYLKGEPLSAAGIVTGQGTVETLHRGGASSQVKVVAAEPVTLQFYTYDYPGWQVTLNGHPLPHRPEPPYGLITVDVPAGDHTLLLGMGSTPPRTLGAIISGLALLAITGLYFWNHHQLRPKPNIEER